ncbi:receptor expression-enhancing protein 5-like [Centruroides sculpturatus]|uniref:receptor expression-enhancing protein 5-like n=1 Tax=Centruroides sculpturatus TaxID=218467 RepID=UPI000C6EF9F1|nr:receptor expression-enhancing protein 5-like [Centruroides sculpturatus]
MFQLIRNVFNVVYKKLRLNNANARLLDKLGHTFGLKREQVFLVFVLFLGVYLIIGDGAEFVCNFSAIIYPIYSSVKSIEQENIEESKRMLMFWTIFGWLYFLERISFFSRYIHYYWILKMVFLLLCFVPIPNNLSDYFIQTIDNVTTYLNDADKNAATRKTSSESQ